MDSVPQEQRYPNAISFNGNISSDFFDVGGGFVAFNFTGPNNEEFPLMLIKGDFSEVSQKLRNGDKLIGIGILTKLQDQWVIKIDQINRIPTEEEIEEYKKFEKENTYAKRKVNEDKERKLRVYIPDEPERTN